MKKNLLLMLFAVLFGAATAAATVNARIQVDNAANVEVTNGMYGTVVSLQDGMNQVELDESAQPLVIKAVDGATIETVTRNGEPVSSGYNGYTLEISAGMFVDITTSGGAGPVAKNYNVWFQIAPLGSISVSYGDSKVLIDQAAYFELPGNTDLTISPESGFSIVSVDYMNHTATDNEDGTWTINVTEDYGYVTVVVKEEGINFTVDVNYPANIIVDANLNEAATETKTLQLQGVGPYTAVAPMNTASLQFNPGEGAEIKSIKRVEADGTESFVSNSSYVGWRAMIAEGDTYVVEAVGPEVDVTFAMERTSVTLDQMVFTVNGNRLDVTSENAVAKLHVGDIVTVTGGKGATLTQIYATKAQMIVSNGSTCSFKVTGAASVYVYADVFNGRTINVDNAPAVVVKDQNGYGDVITLTDGANAVESVKNPLAITAASGYAIVSVVLDGETVTAKSDGSYTVVLDAGSVLSIKTRELPKALPVTFAVVGDYTKLIVANEGEKVELNGETTTISVFPDMQLTVGVAQGYLIESLTAGSNEVVYDETTGVYTITVKAAGTISVIVKEWVAADGNALVTFNRDISKVSAIVYDENGEQVGSLVEGINEIKDGSKVQIRVFGDSYLRTVTVNDVAIELEADAKTAEIIIDGTTTIDVTTYVLCSVRGWQSYNPTNHTTIGYIYINEEGTESGMYAAGETVTILPVPMPGYKFDGFSFIYPEDLQLPETAPYTFTIPEGVTEILFQGNFVEDEEKPTYLVRGNSTLGSLDGSNELTVIAVTRIGSESDPENSVKEKLCYAGETVHLLCFITVEAEAQGYRCQNFTMFYDQSVVVPQDYVVNPEDVRTSGAIELAAVVSKPTGVESVAMDADMVYDSATCTLRSVAAVKIFSASGNLVKAAEAGEISLESLPAGLYIATDGVKTIKIAK